MLPLSLLQGLNYEEILSVNFTASLAAFIQKYFLLFAANALFGKVMEDTLLAATFSKTVSRVLGKEKAVYGAMLATALMAYGGISVFVIVFTVYPILLLTFKEADLPGRFIPGVIMSSTCTFALGMLPGSAQLNNVIPTTYIDTTPAAAFWPGIAGTLVSILGIHFYFHYLFTKARQNGEHFIMTEEVKKRIAQNEKNSDVNPIFSGLPLLLILALINWFKIDLSCAVLCGTVLALLIGWQNLENPLRTLNEGIRTVGSSVITNAAPVGFGGAILSTVGAKIILTEIVELPINALFSLSLAAGFAGLLTGSGGGGCDVAMRLLSNQYLGLGVPPQLLHRIVVMATAAFSCLPHNGMLLLIQDICGATTKESYLPVLFGTVLNGIVCLLVTMGVGLWLC